MRVAAYNSRWVTLQGAFKQPGEGQEEHACTYTIDYAHLNQTPNAADELYLQHGDRIYLGEQPVRELAVLGEVASPGIIPLTNRKISAAQALAIAGGPDAGTADPAGVFVIRKERPEAKIYQLDVSNAAGAALMSQFQMRSDDVLYVAANSSTRLARMLKTLLPERKVESPAETSDIE